MRRKGEIRRPKAEDRKKAEARNPNRVQQLVASGAWRGGCFDLAAADSPLLGL